jgi:hypothetical protein
MGDADDFASCMERVMASEDEVSSAGEKGSSSREGRPSRASSEPSIFYA